MLNCRRRKKPNLKKEKESKKTKKSKSEKSKDLKKDTSFHFKI